MRIGASFDNIRTDVTHAVRSLRRSPGFAAVALLALAVGIGGNTAVFSVIDATREQAIPYADPERLVYLIGNARRDVVERRGASIRLRRLARPGDELRGPGGVRFAADVAGRRGETERIGTEFVSASCFSLLGVAPTVGRTFRPEEDDVAKPSMVIVLSDGLWRRRFGATLILGRPVILNGEPYTVLGVMPAGFSGVTDEAQLWIPFARYAPQARWPIARTADSPCWGVSRRV